MNVGLFSLFVVVNETNKRLFLKKVNFVLPLNFLIFASPTDFCDAFCVAGGAFGRPCLQPRYHPYIVHTHHSAARPRKPPVKRKDLKDIFAQAEL